jgi:hypothetical protein
MANIESILGAMDRINSEMKTAVVGPPERRNQQIVELRTEFSAETGNLLCQLPAEERLVSDPELFDEFQDRLDDVRTMLTQHQTRWSIGNIDERRDDYLIATETVHGKIAAYLDWAKNSLTPVPA